MENIFKKAFLRVLAEQVPLGLSNAEPEMSDADAMKSTLDKGTDPAMLDVHAASREAAEKQVAAQVHMIEKLSEWVGKIEEFNKFLNDPNADSVQSILNGAVPETILDKIRTSEAKRISRVASELSALNEMLKGYLGTRNDAKYRFS